MALQLVQYGFKQEARAVAGPTSHVRVRPLQDSHCLTHNARLPRGSWSVNKERRHGVVRPPQKIQKLADLIPAERIWSIFVTYPFASNQLKLEVMTCIGLFWTERHGDVLWLANPHWALRRFISSLISFVLNNLQHSCQYQIEANWKRWQFIGKFWTERQGDVLSFANLHCALRKFQSSFCGRGCSNFIFSNYLFGSDQSKLEGLT